MAVPLRGGGGVNAVLLGKKELFTLIFSDGQVLTTIKREGGGVKAYMALHCHF